MLQTVDGRKNVYVVDFDTMPELPITWNTPEEEPYAKALQREILSGTIKKPGKYGILFHPLAVNPKLYIIYAIKE